MNRAKKIAALLLSAAMIFTGTVPAFAEPEKKTFFTAEQEALPQADPENLSGSEPVAAVAEEAAPETAAETDAGVGTAGAGMGNDDAEGTADALLSGAEGPIYEKEVVFSGSDWMADLDHDIPLSKLTVPGSHDAGTFNIRFGITNKLTDGIVDKIEGWVVDHLPKNSFLTSFTVRALEFITGGAVLALVNELGELIQRRAGRCQSLTIGEQLSQGVRELDLRFRYEDGKFNVYHGDNEGVKGFFLDCECYDEYGKRLTVEKVLQDISGFLGTHDREVVFLKLQKEGGEYNKAVEEALYDLETKYGVEMRFANRTYSRKVIIEKEGKERSADYYNVNANGYTQKNFFGKMLDVSGALKNAVSESDVRKVTDNVTGAEWEVTPKQKVELFEGSLKKHFGKLEERQTNVQVKFKWVIDPMDECKFEPKLKLVPLRVLPFLPKVPVPVSLDLNLQSLLKTPLENAEYISPRVRTLLEDYVKTAGHEGPGLGVISMDFMKEGYARAVANVNQTTGYGPKYTESSTEVTNTKTLGSGDSEGEETYDWREEYKELEAITELSADFSGAYRQIAENGYSAKAVSYDADGNLVYETENDAVKMINICMDGESIPLDDLHVYAPVTEEYPQAKITVYKRYLDKLSSGTHSFVVFFTDGSEAAPVVIPERVTERDAEPEEKASFTGTWEKPVSGGKWYTDPAGNWHYENNGAFRETWGYIADPGAGGKAQWYLFGKGGELLSGWQQVSGKWYYLTPVHDGSFGACFIGPGRTPDGYEVDASGAWTGR